MKTLLYVILILLSVIIAEYQSQKLCSSNGVFKCVSTTSLRICFLDKLVTSEFSCPNLTFCNENSPTICTKIPRALPAIHFAEELVSTTEETYPEIQCPDIGIFEVENTGCTTYLNCSNLEDAEETECNEVSLFNPETNTCSEDYICPENLDYVKSYENCSQTENNFICPRIGNFPLPNTNCEKFILCKRIYIGLKPILKFCPMNTLFDPTFGRCVEGNVCNDECATTPDTTTPFDELITTPEDSPKCTSVGRFPISNTNCTMYRMCSSLNNVLVHQDLNCPANSYFNPSTTRCSKSYECFPSVTDEPPTTIPVDSPKCTSVGKFPISNTNCTMFRICSSLNNVLVHQDLNCPANSYFNPSTKRCSRSYECFPSVTDEPPTTIPSSTPTKDDSLNSSKPTDPPSTPNNTVSEGTTLDPNDDTTTTSNSISSKVTDEYSSSSLKPTDLPSTPNNTVSEGTTLDPNDDTTTTSDFISTKVTDEYSSSSLKPTDLPSTPTNTVSEGTTLDPNDGEASTSTSNCIITDVTNEDSSSSSKPTNPPSTPNNTVSEGTTLDPNDDDTTTTSNSTDFPITPDTSPTNDIESSTITPNDNESTTPSIDCRSQGRLPVLNTNCKMYYQCTLTTNGYTYKMYECSEGTLFDPYKKICLDSYICPEIILSTSTQLPDSDESSEEMINLLNCTEHGKIPIPSTGCILYGQCILTTSGFIETIFECPEDTLYDPEMKVCSTSYICPETTTLNSVELSTITESPVVSCTEQGKFPILDTKCKNYLSCILTTNGYVSTEYSCSGNLVFDPNLKKCSSSYICKEEKLSTPLIQENNSSSKDIEIPECTNKGKFSIKNTDCSKYILCTITSTGIKSKIYSCPINSYFNPEFQRCQKEYICPETSTDLETITKPNQETTTEEFISEEHSTECVNVLKENPVCVQPGKFPITGKNCKQYILCTKTSLGFRSKIYDCPNNSNFDPNKKKCTVSYNCEEKICENKGEKLMKKPILTECKYPGKFPIKGTHCQKFQLCVWTKFSYNKSANDCPEGTYFNPRLKECSEDYVCGEDVEYNCTTIGQFKDETDATCQYYINCKVHEDDGAVRGERKICPIDLYFDPVKQKCSASYFCKRTRAAKIQKSPKFLINGQCTTVGRYAISGTNCKNYMFCADNGDGTLRGTLFTCPTTSVFNQAIQKCTATYICPDFMCFFTGLAPNPNSIDCTSYIQCEDTFDPITGLIVGSTGRVVFCPIGQKFNPICQCCSSNYVCPR